MSIELSFHWLTAVFTAANLLLGVVALGILVLIVVVDRIVRRAITRYSGTVPLDKNVENGFKLISRIIVFAIGAIALLQVFGVKADWLISVSALGGAAIGFASTQTVGNLLAGVYLMLSRPFLVNDYVRIGEIEGVITEITINYTKLYTPTYNVVAIPNRRILDSTIVNYSKEDVIDWTFAVGVPHDVPTTTSWRSASLPHSTTSTRRTSNYYRANPNPAFVPSIDWAEHSPSGSSFLRGTWTPSATFNQKSWEQSSTDGMQ